MTLLAADAMSGAVFAVAVAGAAPVADRLIALEPGVRRTIDDLRASRA